MTQLETYESTEPLTGTIAEQRRQRRAAFRRFLEQQLQRRLSDTELEQLYSYLRERTRRIEAETALAEERTLRQMVEAENAELVAQNMALKTEIADWVIGADGDLRTRQLAAENAELTERVQQLEAQLAYARHCGA